MAEKFSTICVCSISWFLRVTLHSLHKTNKKISKYQCGGSKNVQLHAQCNFPAFIHYTGQQVCNHQRYFSVSYFHSDFKPVLSFSLGHLVLLMNFIIHFVFVDHYFWTRSQSI